MPTLRQIQMVRALAEHRHFTRAANVLGVTQSALTKSVQALEDELGVRLFERGAGTLEPTMFGAIVLAQGRAVLRDMSELVREVDLAKGLETGGITVSASVFPAELWAPQALGRLAGAHPRLKYMLRTVDSRQAVDDVLEGISDIAIADATEAEGRENLDSEILATTPLALFCRSAHPLARRRDIRPEDFLDYPFAGPPLSRALARRNLGRLGKIALSVSPDEQLMPRISVGSFSAMVQAVLHSDAIGWAPDSLLAGYVKGRVLALLRARELTISATFALYARRHRTLSPATVEFIKLVRAMQPSDARPAASRLST
ncbi:LysR family transcriptional regulator [Bradyrhizobium sp. NAS80.1]|uniref:LysR family transcriptional regulator n=1 Tax=Bradyrhizobium sp. NAS80.1 TaxID=1680159 RepID=UPI000A714261|nr:LysR family transcriptional regulator [Bradyrhizobium sp. NAS80.1]